MAQYTPSAVKPLPGGHADDGDFETTLPKICVDYLSHQWKEEDVWRSWRSMTRNKYEIANGMRLENASWRTWWKQRNGLKTISPEALNWLKDSDVTWLYGPLHQAPAVPTARESSTADKFGIDMPNLSSKPSKPKPSSSPSKRLLPPQSHVQAKPILKKRSISDILAMAIVPPRAPTSSGSPLYEAAAAELEETAKEGEPVIEGDPHTLPSEAGVLQAPARPPLWHTKSDSIIVRQSMGANLSTSPMSIHGLTPPSESAIVDEAKSVSLSPPEYGRPRSGHRSDSSSSYQVSDDSTAPKPKRHISFNSFVEQRIVVDPIPPRLSTVYARSSSDSGSEADEDTILEMRSSSGSSLSSSRRGSLNSRTSSSDRSTAAKAAQMTMITAPIAPTLLKEPDDLPAPSPAVVFVAPEGVNEATLKYEIHLASKPQFAVTADRRRVGSAEWDGKDNWHGQEEMVDYFSGVPLNGEPIEPQREPIYTDEDEDAITVRRRSRGFRPTRVAANGQRELASPVSDNESPVTPETARPLPRKSSFPKKSQSGVNSSPPLVNHEEVAGYRDASKISKPLIVPRRIGSASNVQSSWSTTSSSSPTGNAVGSAPQNTHLSSSMSSMRSSRGRTRPRAESFEGIDMEGHTSALSGRVGFGGVVRSHSAALFSPPRDEDLAEDRGRSQRISEELERPRRGRSLLRTNSSSTISERERSSTTGSSNSPIGSLSPRSSSVGIVGGYITSGTGSVVIAPSGSVRGGSSLRYESGSWSAEEERGVDGGDLAQVIAPRAPPKSKPASGRLSRTSSSNNIVAESHNDIPAPNDSTIKRSSSSTNIAPKPTVLQRSSSSSNLFPTAKPSPQLTTATANPPSLVLQPPSGGPSLVDISVGQARANDTPGSLSGSVASHSPESTTSFWRASELELESPATPPSPIDSKTTLDESSLNRELLLAKNSIKPRASGMSLASSASNGSNSSSTTVVPSQANKSRSSHLSSASSSVSSTASAASAHRRTGSRSSNSNPTPPTPPPAIRSSSASSSLATRHVTPAVATRSPISPSASTTASEKHLRRISGELPASAKEIVNNSNRSPSPASPGSVLSNVVGSAKGFFDALWGGHGEHSA